MKETEIAESRASVYLNRCKEEITGFKKHGYPLILLNAVHIYAIYREISLSYQLPFKEWTEIWEEKL